MYLITGLGNPGQQYEKTPHNSGFLFLEKFRLALKAGTQLTIGQWDSDKMFESEFCKIEKDGDLLFVLQKPETFVNRSGFAVKKAIQRFRLTDYTSEFILVHDDLDLKLGTYKIAKGKSPKAHNGVIDVENFLKGKDFLRVRIGVDARQDRDISGEKYVLIPFNDDEYKLLEESISAAINDLRSIIQI